MKYKNNKKCISIDFGNRYLKFALGQFDGSTLNVERFFKKEIEPEIIENGIILDEAKLAEIISKTLAKNNIKAKHCYGYVYGSDIIRKNITVPMLLDHKDMDDLVITEISQILPIDIDNYVVKYKIMSDSEEDSVKKLNLACAVMSKETVESYRKVIKLAGLKPTALDVSTSAIENLVSLMVMSNTDTSSFVKQEISQSSICIAELNSTNCSINVFKGGKLDFTRSIKTNEISEEIFIKLSQINDMNDIEDNTIFDLINEMLSEINIVFRYYLGRNRENKIDELFCFGDLSCINGFDKYIMDILQMSVNKIDTLTGIVDKTADNDDITLYVNSIGGLIRW